MFRLLPVAIALMIPSVLLADDKKSKPGEAITVIAVEPGDKIALNRGKATEPSKVTTAEELEKLITDEATRKRLSKLIDFKTQTLLVFAWQGSGQDKLDYAVLESYPEQIAFQYKPGRTKDLRTHVHLYSLRNNVKWSVK